MNHFVNHDDEIGFNNHAFFNGLDFFSESYSENYKGNASESIKKIKAKIASMYNFIYYIVGYLLCLEQQT